MIFKKRSNKIISKSPRQLGEKMIPSEMRYKDSDLYIHYVCSICMEVCNLPRQCKDGHLFCLECIQKQIEHSSTCPECRQEITMSTINRNLVAEKQIENLLMWCRYHFDLDENEEWVINEQGCNEAMPVVSLAGHEKQCTFAWSPCSYSQKCGKIRKKDIKEHEKDCKYRIIECEFCFCSVQLFMLNDHHTECASVPIKCNYCGEYPINRGNITAHEKNSCPEFLIQCPYKCKEKFKRKELVEHNKEFVADHLNYLRLELQHQYEFELKARDKKIQRLNSRVEFLTKKLQNISEGGLIQWKLEWDRIEKENYIQETFCFETVDLTILLYPNGDTLESNGYISLFFSRQFEDKNREFQFFLPKDQKIYVKKIKYYFEIVNHLEESKSERSCDIIFSLYSNREALMKGNRFMIKNSLISKETGFLNEEGELWINVHMDHIKTDVYL